MSKTNEFGIGLMHEVAIAAAKHGWSPDELSALCKHPYLIRQFRGVLLGTYYVDRVECIIDSDVIPFIPEGCSIEHHIKNGMYNWWQNIPTTVTPGNVKSSQESYSYLSKEGRVSMYKDILLNASMLDYVLVNQHLIPDTWKTYPNCKKGVMFYGTVYLDAEGSRFVRGMVCKKGIYEEIRTTLIEGVPGPVYAAIMYIPKVKG